MRKMFLALALWGFALCLPAWSATYYVSARGSDASDGTTKSTPWQHAPGMTACTANCAAVKPRPGDHFILRGGDSWHWADSSAIGIPWIWKWSGTPVARIYIGVDQTWFSGGTWERPVLNGDNPPSLSPVLSCAHYSSNFFVQEGNYTDTDGIELLGMCYAGSDGLGAATCWQACDRGNINVRAENITLQNLYIHGWTHKPFRCVYTTMLTGDCDTGLAIYNDSHSEGDVNNRYVGIIVDGSDSDRRSFACMAYGGYDVHNSVCRFTSQGYVTNNNRFFHDNLIEYIYEANDGVKHSNAYEQNGSLHELFWYNNIVRHIGTLAPIGVNLWFNPGGNLYYFNNVIYDEADGGANYFDIAGTNGTYFIYNSTFCCKPTISNNNFQPQVRSLNNHFIGAATSADVFLSMAGVVDRTSVYQSLSTATTQGFKASNDYASSSPSAATSRLGTNLTAFCARFGSALCSDATLGGTRLPVARPTSGPWDAGAYQSARPRNQRRPR